MTRHGARKRRTLLWGMGGAVLLGAAAFVLVGVSQPPQVNDVDQQTVEPDPSEMRELWTPEKMREARKNGMMPKAPADGE